MSTKTVYASTACVAGHQPLLQRVEMYRAAGIRAIELGARVTFDGAFRPQDLPADVPYLIHNYFPAPADPFILNLASADESIRKRSIDLAKNALHLSASLHANAYSIHAGFITDPSLTFAFTQKPGPAAAKDALRRFVVALGEVLEVADACGVQLLVENNVCTVQNKGQFLCQTPEEFAELFSLLPSKRLGILLDTGHLTVSAATFGFEPLRFVEELGSRVGALHIHMNDGNTDQHRPVEEGCWVIDALRKPDIAKAHWIVEASFHNAEALAAHARFLEGFAG